MDPELKRQLEEIRALAKDNHRMLRTMRRHQIYSLVGTIIMWVVLLVLPLYLYQQYLQPFVSTFSTTIGIPTSGLPTSADIQKLINSFKAK